MVLTLRFGIILAHIKPKANSFGFNNQKISVNKQFVARFGFNDGEIILYLIRSWIGLSRNVVYAKGCN